LRGSQFWPEGAGSSRDEPSIGLTQQRIEWPGGRQFAFTVFDDPDGQTLPTSQLVYSFLADLGFRTTIAVWPLDVRRERNSGGETCANGAYRDFLRSLQSKGFEIAFHHAAPHSSSRAETIEALDRFAQHFGGPPAAMANHYNQEALYWGTARLSGLRRAVYNLVTLGRNEGKFFGDVNGHPAFWGDVCYERIRYCRNFVYRDINTLRSCPWMPYADPKRPYVRAWFAASEGAAGGSFMQALSERNQDRLEEQGGLSIMYTHFGHGFVEGGQLHPRFRQLMERLARKRGWLVPTTTILDFLSRERGTKVLDENERRRLEGRWLREKFLHGTS